MNMNLRFFPVVWLALLLASIATNQVQAKVVDASIAGRCSSIEKCYYFRDVYSGTPQLRNSLKVAFRSARLDLPEWVTNHTGVESQMIPVVIEGKPYLIGSVCEPHFCFHNLVVLYSSSTGSVIAAYNNPYKEQLTYFGNPSEKQRQVLSDHEDSESKLFYALQNPKSLPLTID